MLSSMETALGLTIISPEGATLRIQKSNPLFQGVRELVRSDYPTQQAWAKLQELLAHPLKSLIDWAATYGMQVTQADTSLVLEMERNSSVTVPASAWTNLLNRLKTVNASPVHAFALAQRFEKQEAVTRLTAITACIHARENQTPSAATTNLLGVRLLPADVRIGDKVNLASLGKVPALVSYDHYRVTDAGQIELLDGFVLQPAFQGGFTEDVMAQPAILGFNRTYRCEEGTEDGWLEDLSFDSLKEAQVNIADIENAGGEARIINRITGKVVHH